MSIVVSVVNGLQLRWRWLVFFHGIRETNGKAWSVYWNRDAGVPLWVVGNVGFSWRRWWGYQKRELVKALMRWLAKEESNAKKD